MIQDFGPVLFEIPGLLRVQWFGFFLFLGVIVINVLLHWIVRRQKAGMAQSQIASAVFWIALGVVIGGRLGYGLFYDQNMFFRVRGDFPFWGPLALGEGGLSWHGSIGGAILTSWLFAFRHGVSQMLVLDLAAWVAPVLLFFCRIGSYFSGELLGRPASAEVPFSFRFPTEILRWPSESPDKLAALGTNVDVDAVLAQFRSGETLIVEKILPLLSARYPFALISALSEGILVFMILFFFWKSPKRPGSVVSAYLFTASLAGLSFSWLEWSDPNQTGHILGFTVYQWLCAATFIASLVFYLLWVRSRSMFVPGWSRGTHIRVHRRNV